MLRKQSKHIALFQSTLPREERRYCNTINKICYNFNPRSHERSDAFSTRWFYAFVTISIHAPTRGATTSQVFLVLYLQISIHAPTRGATLKALAYFADLEFQSTLPREERHKSIGKIKPSYKFQSTLPREERLR